MEKRIQIDNIQIETVYVNSSNVSKVGYSDEWVILAIEYINGSLIYYLDIPRDHYDKLLNAPSIGSYLHREIKGNYRYVKIK